MSNRDLVEVPYSELRVGDRDGVLGVGRRVIAPPRVLPGGRVEIVMQWSNGQRATARPEAHRKARVKRAVVGAGLPLRHRGRARTTPGTVEVFDTEHPDSPVTAAEARGQRWAMRCEHGTVIGRPTLALARADVEDPRLWCVSCVERAPGALTLL